MHTSMSPLVSQSADAPRLLMWLLLQQRNRRSDRGGGLSKGPSAYANVNLWLTEMNGTAGVNFFIELKTLTRTTRQ